MKEVVGWVQGKVDISISRLSLMFHRVLRVFINTNHREPGSESSWRNGRDRGGGTGGVIVNFQKMRCQPF